MDVHNCQMRLNSAPVTALTAAVSAMGASFAFGARTVDEMAASVASKRWSTRLSRMDGRDRERKRREAKMQRQAKRRGR